VVGDFVGSEVRLIIGLVDMGDDVGLAVGEALGSAVGLAVGPKVIVATVLVGDFVGLPVHVGPSATQGKLSRGRRILGPSHTDESSA